MAVRPIRWGAEKRLAYIDFSLYWEGRINRKDLTRFFNISTPQASADLKKYIEMAPEHVGYEKSGKYYYPTNAFKPKLISPTSESYLNEILSLHLGLQSEDTSFIKSLPAYACVPLPYRRVEPTTLFRVLNAIHTKKAIHVNYASMTSQDSQERWISPHAICFDGFRWHTRAYCHKRQDFRDFIFGRIIAISQDEQEIPTNPLNDTLWHTEIQVRIIPNPKLDESRKEIVKLDYGMVNGESIIKTRASMLFYLLKQLGLLSENKKAIPTSQHISLANFDDISSYLNQP